MKGSDRKMGVAHIAEEERLRVYEQIIACYLRYVLIRSSDYTDSRSVAGRIAFYTFISTYVLAERLKYLWQFGWLIDSLVDVIADDMAASNYCRRQSSDETVLLADQNLAAMARAINTLDVFTRQVFVLHHLELLSTREISAAYETSVSEVRSAVERGERKIVEYFACLWQDVSILSFADVHCLLADLRDALNLNMEQSIAEFALSYLDEAAGNHRLNVPSEQYRLN